MFIILGLLVVLFIFYKKNKRANDRARRSELWELVVLAGRNGRHQDSPRDPPPPYPGLSSGYPGSPPTGYPSGMQNTNVSQCSHVPAPVAFPAINFPANVNALGGLQGLQQLAALASTPAPPADWGQIREISTGPRPRVSYAHERPESILRTSSRRSVGLGLSRSGSLHSLHEASAPPTPVHASQGAQATTTTVSPVLQSVLDRLEAEENAANQLQQ